MATAVGSINVASRTLPLTSGHVSSPKTVPGSSFLGCNLKVNSNVSHASAKTNIYRIAAEIDETKQTAKDRWKGLAYDISDDQQDITRGKGMVDSLFQAPMGTGTHHAVMTSYEYISTAQRT